MAQPEVSDVVAAPATSFAALAVPPALCTALAKAGVTAPFAIQQVALPPALAGLDVLGRARTGSGKTLAFALPTVVRLAAQPRRCAPGRPRALILAPTRELAGQIDMTLAPLAAAVGLRTLVVIGGVPASRQASALRAGVDVLVACPGRLADLISTGACSLRDIEITVLDEADHMADLGFLPSVRRLLDATPTDGQRLLFSATLDAAVDVLVTRYLHDPARVEVPDPVAQSPLTHHVLDVPAADRVARLDELLTDLVGSGGRAVVFTRTKHGAKRLAKQLGGREFAVVELHGNLAQNARDRSLAAFGSGAARVLVATDIAARGIHVDDVGLVVHFDVPVEHKAYVHRSGRTGRAGTNGHVVTFTGETPLPDVQRLLGKAGATARTHTHVPPLARAVRGA